MIVGLGSDIIKIARIKRSLERFGDKFIRNIFTVSEIKAAEKYNDNIDMLAAFYAKRFAAKEAYAKALGTGFCGGLWFTDIEIYNDNNGRPHITHKKQGEVAHLSLADTDDLAQAFVIIEKHSA